MTKHRTVTVRQKEGGQKTNVTAHLAQCLALLYLQEKYPKTIIRSNTDQDRGGPPYDLEQLSKDDHERLRRGLVPYPGSSEKNVFSDNPDPVRIWEVKGLIRKNKTFLVNPNAHQKLIEVKTKKGISYVFVLFENDLNYSSGKLACRYQIQEISGKEMTGLLRKAKSNKGYKKIRSSWIFTNVVRRKN
jgi:hypothetical protein